EELPSRRPEPLPVHTNGGRQANRGQWEEPTPLACQLVTEQSQSARRARIERAAAPSGEPAATWRRSPIRGRPALEKAARKPWGRGRVAISRRWAATDASPSARAETFALARHAPQAVVAKRQLYHAVGLAAAHVGPVRR